MTRKIITPDLEKKTSKEQLKHIQELLLKQLTLQVAKGVLDRNELEALKVCLQIERDTAEQVDEEESDFSEISTKKLLKLASKGVK